MKGFNNWNDYRIFRDGVIAKYRHAHSDKTKQFIETVLETCKNKSMTIPKDYSFWRARLGADNGIPLGDGNGNIVDYEPVAYEGKDIEAPPAEKTRDGRVNAEGIPCLYLCSHKGTAMSEVNPCLGETISVAEFRTVKHLKIVDFTANDVKDFEKPLDSDNFHVIDSMFPSPIKLIEKTLTQNEINQTVWFCMDQAFAEPVNATDCPIKYVPTQIIAENLKANKYDGIKYKSAKGKGYNLALFDTESAKPIDGRSELYDCIDIRMSFKERGMKRFRPDGRYEYNYDSRAKPCQTV